MLLLFALANPMWNTGVAHSVTENTLTLAGLTNNVHEGFGSKCRELSISIGV